MTFLGHRKDLNEIVLCWYFLLCIYLKLTDGKSKFQIFDQVEFNVKSMYLMKCMIICLVYTWESLPWLHFPVYGRLTFLSFKVQPLLFLICFYLYLIFKGIIHSISKPLLCDQDLDEGVRSSVLGECSCVSKLPNPALHTCSFTWQASSGLHPDTSPDSTGGDAWALQISGTDAPPWGCVLHFPSQAMMWLGPCYWSCGQEWTWDRDLKWLQHSTVP